LLPPCYITNNQGKARRADSCQPCPQNGRCVDGQLECVQGFKRYGGSCIEDGLLRQTAAKIVLHLPSLSSFLAWPAIANLCLGVFFSCSILYKSSQSCYS
jgi:hypothetical protein